MSETHIFRVTDVQFEDDPDLVTHLFGRSAGGDRVHKRVQDTMPYLFVPEADFSPEFLELNSADDKVLGWNRGYESYDGVELVQLICHKPDDVRDMRELFDVCFESDLVFERRCTADYSMSGYVETPVDESIGVDQIESIDEDEVDPIEPRGLFVDIEVKAPDSFYPEFAEEAPNEVTAITSYDSYADEYTLFCLDPDLVVNPSQIRGYIEENWEGHQNADRLTDIDIQFKRFGQEENLLEAFRSYVESVEADYMTGWNYCLPHNSDVQMADGSVKQIADIQPGDDVIGVDGQDVVETSVLKKEETVKESLDLSLQNGDEFSCSPDHMMLVGDDSGVDWKRADNIKGGEYVVRPRKLDIDSSVSITDGGSVTEEEAYLSGLMLADGTVKVEDDKSPKFYNSREELIDQFDGVSGSVYAYDGRVQSGTEYHKSITDDRMVGVLRELGVYDAKLGDFDMLSSVFTSPESHIKAFLAGVIDGDGSVGDNLSVGVIDEELAEWYRKLFARVGVFTGSFSDNQITIGKSECNVQVFDEIVEYMSHTDKVEAMSNIEGSESSHDMNVPLGLLSEEEQRGNPRYNYKRDVNVKRHKTDSEEWTDFVFIQVTDIDRSEEVEMYDIKTGTGTFVADGLVTHNCDFDHEYLVNRMEDVLGFWDIRDLSPMESVGGYQTETYIKGLPAIDMMEAYCDKLVYGKLKSKSLDYVSKSALGVGKIEGDDNSYDKNRTKFMAYNIVDTQLCVELDREFGVLDFWFMLADVCAIPPYEVGSPMKEVEGFFFKHREDDEILPDTDDDKELDTISGGFVMPPSNGVEDWVGVLDLKSLYPSSMISCNISPETMTYDLEEADIIVPDMPLNYEDVPGDKITQNDIGWKLGEGACIGFSLDEQGIIPKYQGLLFDNRAEMKSKRNSFDADSREYKIYDMRQRAIKVVMNTVFGVLDHPYFRLCEDGLGAAITSVSRFVSWVGIQAIEDQGYHVKYGDSVTGDTNVVCRYDGRVFETEISNLPFEYVEGGKDRITIDGLEVLSVDEDGNQVFRSVKQAIRHRTDKQLYEVTLSDGSSVKVTEDHSMLKWGDKGIQTLSPKSLVEGQSIPVCNDRVSNLRERVQGTTSSFGDSRSLNRGIYREVSGSSYNIRGDEAEKVRDEKAVVGGRRVQGENNRVSQRKRSVEQGYGRAGDEGENWRREVRRVDSETSRECKGDVSQQSGVAKEKETRGKGSSKCSDVAVGGKVSEGIRVTEFGLYERAKNSVRSLESRLQGSRNTDIPRWLLVACMSEMWARAGERHTEAQSGTRSQGQRLLRADGSGVCSGVGSRDKSEGSGYGIAGSAEVVSVEKIDSDGEYVYDLSVEDTETFIADGVYVHNTDSLMVSLTERDGVSEDQDTDAFVEMMESLESDINQQLTMVADQVGIPDEHPYFLDGLHGTDRHLWVYEAEKLYRRFLQTGAKKRYAGNIVWKEGKYVDDTDVSGFETVKSDAATITQDVQEEFIERILEGDGYDELTQMIQENISGLESMTFDLEYVGFPSSLNKPPEEYPNMPVKRATLYSNKHLGYDWQSGDDPWLVYVDKTPRNLPDTDVIALSWQDENLPSGFEIDVAKHLDKSIKSPLDPIIESLEFTWTELKTGKREQSVIGGSGGGEIAFNDEAETGDPFEDI